MEIISHLKTKPTHVCSIDLILFLTSLNKERNIY